jgi:hypothetical protein
VGHTRSQVTLTEHMALAGQTSRVSHRHTPSLHGVCMHPNRCKRVGNPPVSFGGEPCLNTPGVKPLAVASAPLPFCAADCAVSYSSSESTKLPSSPSDSSSAWLLSSSLPVTRAGGACGHGSSSGNSSDNSSGSVGGRESVHPVSYVPGLMTGVD